MLVDMLIKRFPFPFWLFSSSLVFCLLASYQATAQIVPDGTLPVNSTVRHQSNTSIIEGGTRAGGNLFHSFQEFSVPTGTEAFFNNALDIQNIFSRVTGGSISNIDGLIRANGTANLFLLNSKGIIFGSNAQLNIGGSFLASTASSLKFADGTEFLTTVNQPTPLLTISIPVGLQIGSSPGQIVNRSSAVAIAPSTGSLLPVGLQVQPGKTLALLGGDILLESGFLTSPGGRIELGSIQSGFVSLTQNPVGFALGYQAVPMYGDIQLFGQSAVNASGVGGGDIQVQGRRVTLTDTARIASLTLGSLPGGNLTVNASESVELIGNGSGFNQLLLQFIGNTLNPTNLSNGLFTFSFGSGSAGNLMINARSLIIRDGGIVSAVTLGSGVGGNVTVNTTDNVEVSGSFLGTGTNGSGHAGDLTINTSQLIVRQGLAATSSLNTGIAGRLTVNASLVELSGGLLFIVPTNNGTILRISSGLNTSGVLAGNAGDLTINTQRLIVRDGGGIAAATTGSGIGGTLTVNASDSVELIGFDTGLTVATYGSGIGGDVRINTRRLIARDGGGADASTFGPGEGGNLTVNASDSVELIGKDGGLATRSQGDGNAGNLRIETGRLTIRDGAGVGVQASKSGSAGNLEIEAAAISLGNQGFITGESTAGEGNISVRSPYLLLRRGSSITTNATGSNVIGGNITINTDVLTALENSNITADSRDFRGGRVVINTQSIFRSSSSQITATGAGGNPELSGIVQINTPDVQPTSGLIELPQNPSDPTQQIAQGCPANKDSTFIVTGSGGLPPNLGEGLRTDGVVDNWVTLEAGGENTAKPVNYIYRNRAAPNQIVEAQGWIKISNGEIVLTTSAPSVTPYNSHNNTSACHAP